MLSSVDAFIKLDGRPNPISALSFVKSKNYYVEKSFRNQIKIDEGNNLLFAAYNIYVKLERKELGFLQNILRSWFDVKYKTEVCMIYGGFIYYRSNNTRDEFHHFIKNASEIKLDEITSNITKNPSIKELYDKCKI